MRLLLISTEFLPGPGGIGTHAYQLARHLKSFGWDVTVLTSQDYVTNDAAEEFNKSQDFSIVPLPRHFARPLSALYRSQILCRYLRELRPTLLVASGESAILLAAICARIYRQRMVAVTHGAVLPRWQSWWSRWSYKQAAAVICVSEYTRMQLLRTGVLSPVTKVITNGADAEVFTVLPQKEVMHFRGTLVPETAKIILTVGHVTLRKAQDVVIRALPEILKEQPNAHYFAVGIPHRKAEFSRLAKELHVSDHVHFPGVVDQSTLVRYLNACDVFVMVSRHTEDQWEGYGIAVAEAALCGKPAVVSANSGVLESISPGVTGLSVCEDDIEGTAQAILTFLNNHEVRETMGQAARTLALRRATWKECIRQYHEFFREISSAHSEGILL